jgi:heparosan-N-sulfate-glucuronate 5-epimerase
MKEEVKHIKLPLGDVSLNTTLGVYYIDMRPARIHYTKNIYGGDFDQNGVPYCVFQEVKRYLPINIAQYGFMLHADYLSSKNEIIFCRLKNCVEKLVELATITPERCVWWHEFDNGKYTIPAPWASAMAQGEVISLFLRYYQLTQEEEYLNLSLKAFHFLKHDVSNKGVRRYDENNYLWFEEYPSTPPSYVLNGFIYTLFGLYDLFRVTSDPGVKEDIDACIETLKTNLHRFDAGYWSYYDLYKKELVRYYYQKNVHVPQLEVLYLLTKESVFLKYKMKWERTVNPFNYALVQLMYRILPRWRNKKLRL